MTADGVQARSARAAYPIALGSVACATLVVAVVDALTSRTPFLLLVLGVALAAAHGGWRPGLLAAALAAVAGNYLFIHPRYELSLDWHVVRVTASCLIAVPLSYFAGSAVAGLVRGRRADALLTATPLFKDLAIDDRAALASLLKPRHFDAHETIYRAGDGGHHLFLIRRGRVELGGAGDGRQTTTLRAGDCFGDLSLLDGGPRTETARATTTVELLSLHRADFRRFVTDRPAAARSVVTALARRQREIEEQLPPATGLG